MARHWSTLVARFRCLGRIRGSCPLKPATPCPLSRRNARANCLMFVRSGGLVARDSHCWCAVKPASPEAEAPEVYPSQHRARAHANYANLRNPADDSDLVVGAHEPKAAGSRGGETSYFGHAVWEATNPTSVFSDAVNTSSRNPDLHVGKVVNFRAGGVCYMSQL